MDASHEFFANGRISEHSYSFASDSLSGHDLTDGTGHGTHVAGIVADCTPDSVQLLILRIFNRSGRSSATLMGSSHPLCRAAAGVGHQHQRWMGQRHCQCLRPRHPGPGHFGGRMKRAFRWSPQRAISG